MYMCVYFKEAFMLLKFRYITKSNKYIEFVILNFASKGVFYRSWP